MSARTNNSNICVPRMAFHGEKSGTGKKTPTNGCVQKMVEEQPHPVCETHELACGECSLDVCQECAELCEFCDGSVATAYCQTCRGHHWCKKCKVLFCTACQPTCVNCRSTIAGMCKDCATKSIHELDDWEEEACRFCRQETLVQIYGNLTFE